MMSRLRKLLVLVALLVIQDLTGSRADKPCHAKPNYNQSVVCVCTAEYCDTITREIPGQGEYWTYTSSEGGRRFEKSRGLLEVRTESYEEHNFEEFSSRVTLELDPSHQYGNIIGFGTAVTDSAAINWKSLQGIAGHHLIDSYFSRHGIELNVLRVPIGGTDFSTRGYTYNDLPENDNNLSNFSLTIEDYNYKIPLMKAALKVATDEILAIGSTWTPPVWMKNHHTLTGMSRLKREYFSLYAEYHLKFLEAYDCEGIKFWGLTTTNEPLNSLMSLGNINRMSWNVKDFGEWIAYFFGPMIKQSGKFNHVNIITGDDQRFSIIIWFNLVITIVKDALQYIKGVAFHFYFDNMTPPSMITETMKDYPDIFIISTEACEGAGAEVKVLLGSWQRAENYAHDIIEDLNYNVTGWIDWNLCLDQTGGPSWTGNTVDSAIIVNADKQEFYKQPMFYALGHFSKFIPRGSRRIKMTGNCKDSSVEQVAFFTPRNTIVVEILNRDGTREVTIKVGVQQVTLVLDAKSITTVEFTL